MQEQNSAEGESCIKQTAGLGISGSSAAEVGFDLDLEQTHTSGISETNKTGVFWHNGSAEYGGINISF